MKSLINKIFKKQKPIDEFLDPKEVNGHRFFVIKDPLFHATRRILALNYKLHESQLSVTSSDLQAIVETGSDAVKQGDLSKCGFLFHLLGAQLDLYCTRKTLFEIANCIILVDGEPFDRMTPKHTTQKKHLFETEEEIQSFFFSIAQRFLVAINLVSQDINVEDYLKQKSVRFSEDLFTKWLQTTAKIGSIT